MAVEPSGNGGAGSGPARCPGDGSAPEGCSPGGARPEMAAVQPRPRSSRVFRGWVVRAPPRMGRAAPFPFLGWPGAPREPMFYCCISQIHNAGEIARICEECKKENFWYRALPLSLGSILVTQGLVSKGIFSASSRFGALPKMAIAGVLGFAIGKMSYIGECQKKFQNIGIVPFDP